MRSLYRAICRRYGPGGMTLSAWSHVMAQRGRPWLRNRIDGAALLIFGQHEHCLMQYLRESRD
jgi:hypothetical protein